MSKCLSVSFLNLSVDCLTLGGNLPTEALCQCWPLMDVGFGLDGLLSNKTSF